MRRFHRGGPGAFTLVEILIVVTILALLATVGVIGLTRARITAHEQLALTSLRSIAKACQMFYLTQQRFPNDLTQLGVPPPYLPPDLIGDGATVTKQGYVLAYASGAGQQSFTLHADPVQAGVSGTRYFYTDQIGTIHVDTAGPADATDPILP